MEVLQTEEQRAYIEVLKQVLEEDMGNLGLLEYLDNLQNSSPD